MARKRNRARKSAFDLDPNLEQLRDESLSERTRAHHRNLILVAVSALLIAQLNLAPQKIAAIDVKLQHNDQHVLRVVIGIAVVYFIVLFVVAMLPDFYKWRETLRLRRMLILELDALIERTTQERERYAAGAEGDTPEAKRIHHALQETQVELDAQVSRRAIYRRLTVPIWLKASIDFALPIVLGLVALGALIAGPLPWGWIGG